MFKERKKVQTKVETIQEKVPRIYISRDALIKMQVYVEECSMEVGWLGTAIWNEETRQVLVEDVFLFDQEVHSTTTEITPEGLMEFAEELLEREDGMEIWNKMRVWGHSHVNMGVSPSAQDNSQMKTFADSGHDWFIRLIANKKGDMKLDFYDYKHGVTYLDVPWVEQVVGEEKEVHDAIMEQIEKLEQEIDAMYRTLEQLRDNQITSIKAGVVEEMKEKVRRKTYNYGNYYGNSYYQNGQKKTSSKQTKEKTKTTKNLAGGKNKKGTGSTTKPYVSSVTKIYGDLFINDDEVIKELDEVMLLEIAECEDLEQVDYTLAMFGFTGYFTENDIERIYRVSLKVKAKEELK